MRILPFLYISSFACLLTINTFGQTETLPKFRDPLDIPMYLAGNFGELRSNHFHTGIDIKTESREGIPIHAVEDGYITRIKISSVGYGNTLYMVHPNGYTSVYAHMQQFTEAINQYAERSQYRDESFEVDLFPGPDVFSFKKGDVIGFTGNSGSSGGPHLHFELRETSTEHPVNPLLFGFNIKDEIKPSIYGIMVYPLGDHAAVNGETHPQNFAMGGSFGNYTLKKDQLIEAQGEIGISVHAVDRLTGFPNKCGVYEIKMWVDSTLMYHQKMDALDFATKRYVNAHKDYAIFKNNRKSYHRCYLLPNNKLDIYPTLVNKGKFTVKADEQAQVKLEVTDAYQNKSVLHFTISGKSYDQLKETTTLGHQLMKYGVANEFLGKEVQLSLPPNALYENLKFEYSNGGSLDKCYANIHRLHHTDVPMHQYATLKILPDSTLAPIMKEKALIVKLDDKNRPSAEGGSWEGAYLTTKIREFGNYSIMIDTVAPAIKPLTSIKSRILGNGSEIVFRISDNLSGIADITGKVGENWVLIRYDQKRSRIVYTINKKYIGVGSQPFQLSITDRVGNVAVYDTKIMVK